MRRAGGSLVRETAIGFGLTVALTGSGFGADSKHIGEHGAVHAVAAKREMAIVCLPAGRCGRPARARQDMVIFVPEGEKDDPTRTPAFYDSTFQYLASLGIAVLDS